ncbi:MAG: D-glycero-beta-D-manno-heptose 1-phosphate adenylyltransferase [Marinilabiliales bacterium]|nr:MAG: D-glycero-beta-D-manno-heptose 1-phosphate adenylyltransferase [Marinilabiliales bacterium]
MNNLERVQAKIFDREKLENQLAIWRFQSKKIVFTNGCFDLLHLGHIDYLSKAKDLGDILIIGVNTDDSVRRLKGESRPITDENSRSSIIASLQFVNAVVLFDEDTPYELIKQVQPDVLVKGSDYKPEDIVGFDIVKAKGGEIVTIDYLEGYSTSGIINKLTV